MNYINHNDAYNISRVMNEEGNIYGFNSSSSDTHLMKSSEWGMVSYLTYSKYGTNGREIPINNANLNSGGRKRENTVGKLEVDSVYAITGMTQGNTDGSETVVKIEEINNLQANIPTPTGSMYAWNQKGGITASTTKNMTGIYDISGGTWERTASYVANNHANLLKYGKSVAYNGDALKTESTKYTIVYPHDDIFDNINILDTEENLNKANEANYKQNTKIYGDAIRETSMKGISATSLNKDYSKFAALFAPFIECGGQFFDNVATGSFSFHYDNASSYFHAGFRLAIVPIQ